MCLARLLVQQPTRSSGSPSSSSASHDDEVLLVDAPSRPRTANGAARANLATHEGKLAAASPAAQSTATCPRWTLEVPAPRPLSAKAKGKLPIEGPRAALPPPLKRSASPPPCIASVSPPKKRRTTSSVFDGVEIPLGRSSSSPALSRPAPAPVHTRWTPSDAAPSAHSRTVSPTEPKTVVASPPPTVRAQRRSPTFELVIEGRPHSAAVKRSTPPSSPPALAPSLVAQGPLRSSSLTPVGSSPVVHRAPSSTPSVASTLSSIAETPRQAESTLLPYRAARRAAPVALNFPAKPASHPLNRLTLRPPLAAPPPRYVPNPSFAPAAEIGWVAGTQPKKRAPPARPPPRSRTPLVVLPATVAPPAPDPPNAAGPGARRSGRAKVQAQLACTIYPSASDRVAALAASTSTSTTSSRASSVSATDDPRSRASPRAAAAAKPVRRKPVMAQLRARYAFLAEANRAPFRADNSCDGINPEPLSFEWDELEVRAVTRAEGWPRWKDEELEMRWGANEVPHLVLRAEEGDKAARRKVRRACTVTEWRYRGLDEAIGCASNKATGWATRDWRMVLQGRDEEQGEDDEVEVCAAGKALSMVAMETPSVSPPPPHTTTRKRGATITDVPPSTSSVFLASDDVDMRDGRLEIDTTAQADAVLEPEAPVLVADSDSSDDELAGPEVPATLLSSDKGGRERSASTASSRSSDLVITPSRRPPAARPYASAGTHARPALPARVASSTPTAAGGAEPSATAAGSTESSSSASPGKEDESTPDSSSNSSADPARPRRPRTSSSSEGESTSFVESPRPAVPARKLFAREARAALHSPPPLKPFDDGASASSSASNSSDDDDSTSPERTPAPAPPSPPSSESKQKRAAPSPAKPLMPGYVVRAPVLPVSHRLCSPELTRP